MFAIAAGHEHSLFLDDNGHVWATGNNDCHQLGLVDYKLRFIPTKIENLPTIHTRKKFSTKSARNIAN